jgi:hypothetical protein
MFKINLIPHKEITNRQLEEIIKIKSKAWPYSFYKQLEWISANIKESDIHVLLTLEQTSVAYLNLIKIEFKIDGIAKDGLGIGNVCAIERGNGYGREIISQTNFYLENKKEIGLLFCKESLVNFYSLNLWHLVEKKRLLLSFDNKSIETMIFNYYMHFNTFEYLGKAF